MSTVEQLGAQIRYHTILASLFNSLEDGARVYEICAYQISKWTGWFDLTHWGRVTHICVGNLTIMGSDNGLSPCRHQAIICTNAGLLLIGPSGTKFSEILIEIHTFSFRKIYLKNVLWTIASILSRSQCYGTGITIPIMDTRLTCHKVTWRIGSLLSVRSICRGHILYTTPNRCLIAWSPLTTMFALENNVLMRSCFALNFIQRSTCTYV